MVSGLLHGGWSWWLRIACLCAGVVRRTQQPPHVRYHFSTVTCLVGFSVVIGAAGGCLLLFRQAELYHCFIRRHRPRHLESLPERLVQSAGGWLRAAY